MIALWIPLATHSESNLREHWSKRAQRARSQRSTVAGLARPSVHHLFKYLLTAPLAPVVVTITRVAPRLLDDDNLRGGVKHIRDGIADALGLPNDRDPRVEWRYRQAHGQPRQYAVLVTLRIRSAGAREARG